MNFSLFVAVIAAFGGLLFGYNTSVISGVLLFISNDFQLTTFQQELIVSTILVGAVIGAFAGGFLADAFGRKKSMFFSLALFLVGTFTLGDAVGFDTLLAGRFITGLAIGIVSVAAPLYIAEMSPHKKRGALVSLYQLAITIGILIAYIVSYAYSESAEWREMFFFGLIPLGIQCIGLFFIPETPSWLLSRNRKAEADIVLHKMHRGSPHQSLTSESQKEDVPTKKGWKELFSPSVRMAFLIGIGMSVIQQITGINTVIYYAPRIFQLAGYQSAQTAIFATLLVGIVNVAITVGALWLIDRLGRRPLLIGGLIGMAASLLLLGFSFFSSSEHRGLMAVIALMFYVSFFAVSLGPVTWLIISEVFPLGIRGRAIGVAVFANWVCNYIVSLTFLSLLETFGPAETFWLYGAICLFGLWFVIARVPETKGKTFEQIQNFWKK